jgi:hypothetical protein
MKPFNPPISSFEKVVVCPTEARHTLEGIGAYPFVGMGFTRVVTTPRFSGILEKWLGLT